jgi:hypothetical protein
MISLYLSRDARVSSAYSFFLSTSTTVNVGFETTSTNAPLWVDTTSTTDGRFEVISGVNLYTSTGYCAGSRVAFRVSPPTSGGGELEIRFNNSSNQEYLYHYADDFQAVAV